MPYPPHSAEFAVISVREVAGSERAREPVDWRHYLAEGTGLKVTIVVRMFAA